MPPRRPVRQQQQPATFMARVVKLAVMLALIYGGKVAFLSAMRAYGPRSAVDKLADPANVAAAMGADVGMKEPETPAEVVTHSIAKNRVMIFSKSYCPHSMRGKAVMRKHLGEDGVTVLELDGREDMGQLQDELQRITGARTVPRIFIDGVFVGGASDVAELDASGELAKMLQAKGLTS